jgi:hypothetical protein
MRNAYPAGVSSFTSESQLAANRAAREAPKEANFQVIQNMGCLCDDLIGFGEFGVRVRKVCPELNIISWILSLMKTGSPELKANSRNGCPRAKM